MFATVSNSDKTKLVGFTKFLIKVYLYNYSLYKTI